MKMNADFIIKCFPVIKILIEKIELKRKETIKRIDKIERNSVTRKESIIAVAFLFILFIIVQNAGFQKIENRLDLLERRIEGLSREIIEIKTDLKRKGYE